MQTQGGRCVSAVAVLVLMSATTARAEDVDALIHQGVELRLAHKDSESLEVFRRAVSVRRTPRALVQLGLAEQATGLWAEAEADLQEATKASGDEAWMKKNHDTIVNALNIIGQHLGSVSVWGTPAGAEVLINNRVVGTLPTSQPARVPIGDAQLAVRAEGYLEMSRALNVRVNTGVVERIDLVPLPKPKELASLPSSSPPPPPSPPPLAATEALETKVSPAERSPSPIYARWWFWTAVGVVAAGAVTAGILFERDKQPSCQVTCTTWTGSGG